VYRRWSEEELIYLEDNWGNSFKSIAMYLGRSIYAIKQKAVKLGLGDSRTVSENIILAEFYRATKINKYTVINVWVKNGLKLKNKKSNTGNRTYQYIDIEKFWKWAESHKELVNFANWEENIVGEEPQWAKEKRKADSMDPSKVEHNRVWTDSDKKLLIDKVKTYRYTYEDLALEFNRTQAAVKKKLYELGVPYRPIPKNNGIKWTSDEKEKLQKFISKGFSSATIAKLLHKSELSIKDKIRLSD
jgi:hypothetical protein